MRKLWCGLAVVLALAGAVRAEDPVAIIMRADFEDAITDNFETSFTGSKIGLTDAEFSRGKVALRCTGEAIIDVERYIKYQDRDTRIGFHYKAAGYHCIRVLAGCVEEHENLYFNLMDVPQGRWAWAVVKFADLRNVIPRHGGPECPFGDRSGQGKSFRNIVFHLLNPDKAAEEPSVVLDRIVIWSGPDTVPPTLGGPPAVQADAQGRFLSWPEAQDNVGVAYYLVLRSEAADLKGAATAPNGETVLAEYPLKADERGFFQVVAVDFTGNRSQPSAAVAVTPAAAK